MEKPTLEEFSGSAPKYYKAISEYNDYLEQRVKELMLDVEMFKKGRSKWHKLYLETEEKAKNLEQQHIEDVGQIQMGLEALNQTVHVSEVEELKKYLNHLPICSKLQANNYMKDVKCTCGLNVLI